MQCYETLYYLKGKASGTPKNETKIDFSFTWVIFFKILAYKSHTVKSVFRKKHSLKKGSIIPKRIFGCQNTSSI